MSTLPVVRQAQRDMDLGRLAVALLDVLLDRLDVVEFRPIKMQELEDALTRSRPQVSGALRELAERGYIERGGLAWARGPRMYRLRFSRGATLPAETSRGVEQSQPADEEPRSGPRYGMLSRGVE